MGPFPFGAASPLSAERRPPASAEIFPRHADGAPACGPPSAAADPPDSATSPAFALPPAAEGPPDPAAYPAFALPPAAASPVFSLPPAAPRGHPSARPCADASPARRCDQRGGTAAAASAAREAGSPASAPDADAAGERGLVDRAAPPAVPGPWCNPTPGKRGIRGPGARRVRDTPCKWPEGLRRCTGGARLPSSQSKCHTPSPRPRRSDCWRLTAPAEARPPPGQQRTSNPPVYRGHSAGRSCICRLRAHHRWGPCQTSCRCRGATSLGQGGTRRTRSAASPRRDGGRSCPTPTPRCRPRGRTPPPGAQTAGAAWRRST
mmetsp:Transcript_37120/g.112230  ORF Transcript_37120/g.112230 Transcript_37120/m.112230 type:complete len:320 (-) Transcript_37120:97-1056(-)